MREFSLISFNGSKVRFSEQENNSKAMPLKIPKLYSTCKTTLKHTMINLFNSQEL